MIHSAEPKDTRKVEFRNDRLAQHLDEIKRIRAEEKAVAAAVTKPRGSKNKFAALLSEAFEELFMAVNDANEMMVDAKTEALREKLDAALLVLKDHDGKLKAMQKLLDKQSKYIAHVEAIFEKALEGDDDDSTSD